MYGYNEREPFTGLSDCPVCEGSGIEGGSTAIPHSEFVGGDCWGRLYGRLRGGQIDIARNYCRNLVCTVPVAHFTRTIAEMEAPLPMDAPKCPYCGSVNVLPGVERILAFTCRNCAGR